MFTMKDVLVEEQRRVDKLNRSMENYRLFHEGEKSKKPESTWIAEFLGKLGEHLVRIGGRWQLLSRAQEARVTKFTRPPKFVSDGMIPVFSSARSQEVLKNPVSEKCLSCELRQMFIQMRAAGLIA